MRKKHDFEDVTVKKIPESESISRARKHIVLSLSGTKIKKVHTIRSRFGLIVLLLFGAAGGVTALIFYVLQLFSFYDKYFSNGAVLVAAMTLTFIFLGIMMTGATLRIWFGRVTRITEGLREIAKGNFSARVSERDQKEVITELGDLEKTFNQMASDLEGIEMFRNDFINNFSHEFKTPIVSIRGFARQLQSGNLTEEQKREYIDIIVSESERLATMSQNVLLLTKLENQSIVTEKTEFDLDEQIRNCILLLEKSWEEKNIELDLELDEVEYVFNEEMLSHLWINLLSNAIKFTPDGGKISCRLKKENGAVVFVIRDTGPGMTEEVKARIFEKFYQGDTSHTGAGNGIGLNIVQRIVTLADGEIIVESELQKGSAFTVILP
ncbi:MAG: HAMP domain-containing histidine kinase [Clostridia bacterium]|nr:HAMP domain-containing histidine kinase [Clostridia bacterium]